MSEIAQEPRNFIVADDDHGIRLDRWFKRHMPDASFNIVSRWARTGQLRLDAKRVAPGDHIAAGQTIRVPPLEAPAPAKAKPKRERAPLSPEDQEYVQSMMLHKDRAAIVINKPPGLATQGGTKTERHLDGLLDGLQFEAEGRPKLVHRLDKDTSGVLLLARSSGAAAHFAKAFSSRTARKLYWALIVGVPSIEDGMIELPIAKQPGTGGEKMQVDEAEGQPARTRYRVIERAGNQTAWVELQPFTGRTHQLRVHMAAIGHPIVGDGKYGGPAAFLTGGVSRKMHLHARRIRTDHPDGGKIEVTAETPQHFTESLHMLGFSPVAGDLADYGEIDNLLECVSSYTHEVASLNAANVWNLRTAAELVALRGDASRANGLRAAAEALLPHVRALYLDGTGHFAAGQPDGGRIPVKHCYDFNIVGTTIAADLEPRVRDEMVAFFRHDLQTDNWMRALSPWDPDASFSVRPDHQWNGAYPAWPADAARSLIALGAAEVALPWLAGLARTANQGPPGQAHFVEEALPGIHGGARKAPPQLPYINDWACSSAGAWVALVIESVFGARAGVDGSLRVDGCVERLDPGAVLTGLRAGGVEHSVAAVRS